MRCFLQLALDLVDDLVLHVLDRGAGPDRLHHHDTEGEIRVFLLAHAHQAERAGKDDQPEQEARDARMSDRPAREVEGPLFSAAVGGHGASPVQLAGKARLPFIREFSVGFRAASTSSGERLAIALDAAVVRGIPTCRASSIGRLPPGTHALPGSRLAQRERERRSSRLVSAGCWRSRRLVSPRMRQSSGLGYCSRGARA